MAITESSVIQAGTRVEIRRGPFPSDPTYLGRRGTVVVNSPYQPHKVEVALDGDPQIRTFAPGELEILDDALVLSPDQTAGLKRLARP